MRSKRVLKGFLVLFLITLISGFIGVNVTQAVPQEQTGWDVVYDSTDNNRGEIYNGYIRGGSVSLATRSNGYPGIAFNETGDTDGVPSGLSYTECISGDCASGDGAGYANWSARTQIESYYLPADMKGTSPSLDFDINDKATIIYIKGTSQLWQAKYTPGAGSGCASGDWTCFQLAGIATYAYGNPDIVIDKNNNHFIAYTYGGYVSFAYCDNGSSSNCDEASDYTDKYYNIYNVSTAYGASLDIDSSGILHLTYINQLYDLYYSSCDFSGTGCDDPGDWTTPYKISGVGTNPDSQIDAATSNLGVAFVGGSNLRYAEYVGSNGNCDDSPWFGSDKWSCIDLGTGIMYNSVTRNSAYAMDIYALNGERGIVYGGDDSTHNVHYTSCTSNCTSLVSWTESDVFVDDGNPTVLNPGTLTSIEFGSGPRIAFSANPTLNTTIDVYYAEQEGDLPPEESIVPELPQNALWKVLVAVLALGLVVGVAAFIKQKKK